MKIIITSLLVAIVAFYGGVQFESRVPGDSSVKAGGEEARVIVPQARGDFKNIFGEVVSAEGSVLTIKGDGDVMSKVSVVASTTISKNASLRLSDLKPGFKVVISGVSGSDGLVTASLLNVVQDQVQAAPASTSTRPSK